MTRSAIALSLVLCLATGFLVADGLYTVAEAQGAAEAMDAGPGVYLDPATRPAAVIDPVEDPGGFFADLRRMWRSGAMAPAVILGLFGVAIALRKYVGWFSRGKQAVYFAAAMTALTMLVEVAATGVTPNVTMFATAVLSALLLALRGEAPPNPPNPPLKLVTVKDILDKKQGA